MTHKASNMRELIVETARTAANVAPRKCEFHCDEPATVYGGFRGAGDWAGYACDMHAATVRGFAVWEKVRP